jgi:hypothetical protein
MLLIRNYEPEPGRRTGLCSLFLPPNVADMLTGVTEPKSCSLHRVIARKGDGTLVCEDHYLDSHRQRECDPAVIHACELSATSEGIACPSGILVPVGREVIVHEVVGDAPRGGDLIREAASALGVSGPCDTAMPQDLVLAILSQDAPDGHAAWWDEIARACGPGLGWWLVGAASTLPYAALVNLAGRLSPVEAAVVFQNRPGFDPQRDGCDGIVAATFSDESMRDFLGTLSPFALATLTDASLAALRAWQFDRSADYVVQRRLHSVRGLRDASHSLPRDGRPCSPSDGSCFFCAEEFDMVGLSVGSTYAEGAALQAFVALGSGIRVRGGLPDRHGFRRCTGRCRGGCPDLAGIPLTDETVALINRMGDISETPIYDRPGSALGNSHMTVKYLHALPPHGEGDTRAQQLALYLSTNGEEGKVSELPSHEAMRTLLTAPWLDVAAKVQLLVKMAEARVSCRRDTAEFPTVALPIPLEAARHIVRLPAGSAALARWLNAMKLNIEVEGTVAGLEALAKIVGRRLEATWTSTASKEGAQAWANWLAKAIARAGAEGGTAPKPKAVSAKATGASSTSRASQVRSA